jgi:hypothetical protein
MIGLDQLMHIVLLILIVGGVCWLLWWLIGYIGLPAPFDKVARVIIAVVAVFFLINLLLSLAGSTPLVRIR